MWKMDRMKGKEFGNGVELGCREGDRDGLGCVETK